MVTEGQVYSFEQLKVHALFLSSIRHEDLYAFAREQLGALVEYDEVNHTKLCVTLQEFLYLHNNIESTARSLNLSVSGLKYRLRKAEDILGIDLHNNKICFDIQLAFVILQLFGDYSI
jgi:DNA-binding PucR family transcriptional regulator